MPLLVGAPFPSSQPPPEDLHKHVQLINTAIDVGQHMLAAREADRLAWRVMAEYGVHHEYVLCLRQIGAYAHFLGGHYGRAAHESLELARAWALKGDYAQATDDLVRSASAWLRMPDSEDARQLGCALREAWDRTPSPSRTTGLMHRRRRVQIERRMSALALLRTEPLSGFTRSEPFRPRGLPGVQPMEPSPESEPLRRAVHRLVAEAVSNCQEELCCTEPDQANSWKRRTPNRATDATDTLDMASLLIAAYCRHTGMSEDIFQSYLKTNQQQSRAADPQDHDRAHFADLLDGPAPHVDSRALRTLFAQGLRRAEDALTPEDDQQKLFTEACLHGLRARFRDDVESLADYLPPQVAAMARKVADALEASQPATV